MPKAPRFLASVVAALHRDLRFAPAKTKQRQMDAAEELISRIRPELLYPMDFVVYRVTGYRPETGAFDATVVGRALVRDLGVFVQTLSAEIDLPMDREGGRAIPLDVVAERLGVARRTLQRRRDEGLVLHWVLDEEGQRFLACFPDALDRFLEGVGGRVREMGPWRRVRDDERSQIVAEARDLHRDTGCSLDAAAGMIAARTGRARSTIRRALRAHDRHGAEVIFGEHGPLTSRDARLCERAQGMGIPLSRCGDRFGKSVPAIHRAMLRDRVARLQALPLRWIDLPTFERADADEVLLGTTLVRENLPGPDRVIDLVEIAATQATPDRERLVAAGHCLLARAGHNLASLPGQPTARQVDAIECDLRWTGRIRGALVLEGLSAALQACEHWLGRPVKVLPREAALRFLTRCIHATWQVVEGLEPRLADRLESRCVAAIDRALATRTPPGRGRAAARHAPGDLRCPWPIRELVTWSWLEPGFSWVTRADGLDEDDRGLLSRRWGLGDTRPWRIAELAERRGSTATAVQRRLHAIEVRVRMDR